MDDVSVEVLWTPGCTQADELRRRLTAASRAEGIAIAIEETEVTTTEQARVLRMPGSPTVRIGGRDLEPDAERREDFGLG